MDNSNTQLKLAASIEAILFYTAEPLSFKKLATLTKSSIDDVKNAAQELRKRLEEQDGGIRLLEQNNEILLGTAPLAGPLIEEITREEITKELSKAALETLSIICYKGPLTRSDVDYIRGVNSTFIIRNLLIRGIVEKLENPRDSRAMLYGATFAALEYMGVTKKEDLPQYSEIQTMLNSFISERTTEDEDAGPRTENNVESKNESEDEGAAEDLESIIPIEGDAETSVLTCDSNNDGIMTAEECLDTTDYLVHPHVEEEEKADTNLDADISEENIMNPEFVDSEIIEHIEKDEREESI